MEIGKQHLFKTDLRPPDLAQKGTKRRLDTQELKRGEDRPYARVRKGGTRQHPTSRSAPSAPVSCRTGPDSPPGEGGKTSPTIWMT